MACDGCGGDGITQADSSSDTGTGDTGTSTGNDTETNTGDTETGDTETGDTETGDETDSDDAGTPPEAEQIYYWPTMEDGGSIGTLVTDESHIYFDMNGSLVRVSKTGGGELETIGGSTTGFSNANMILDDTHAYWMNGQSVAKMNKATKEISQLSLGDHYSDIYVLVADTDRLYFTGLGCAKIVTMTKSGEDIRAFTQEVTGTLGGSAKIALSETHIYCSGGGSFGTNTSGKMYRCPKDGDEIELVTTIPDPDWYNSQVGPMAVVGELVYFSEIYTTAGGPGTRLGATPVTGGDPTMEDFILAVGPARLHYDGQRNALYFLTLVQAHLNKFHLDTQELVRVELPEGHYPMSWDEDYLYWASETAIYRMEKF